MKYPAGWMVCNTTYLRVTHISQHHRPLMLRRGQQVSQPAPHPRSRLSAFLRRPPCLTRTSSLTASVLQRDSNHLMIISAKAASGKGRRLTRLKERGSPTSSRHQKSAVGPAETFFFPRCCLLCLSPALQYWYTRLRFSFAA